MKYTCRSTSRWRPHYGQIRVSDLGLAESYSLPHAVNLLVKLSCPLRLMIRHAERNKNPGCIAGTATMHTSSQDMWFGAQRFGGGDSPLGKAKRESHTCPMVWGLDHVNAPRLQKDELDRPAISLGRDNLARQRGAGHQETGPCRGLLLSGLFFRSCPVTEASALEPVASGFASA